MRVLVVGAGGGTGRLLVDRLLLDGHDVRAMVREPGDREALQVRGAEPVVADLEGALDHAFVNVDAVVFCAGSGSRTGADATLRVDLHGVVRSVDLCVQRGIRRFLLLSSWNAGDPMRGPREDRRHYYAAKHAADRILACSGLEHTIVRPGRLTDDDPCGRVRIGTDLERPGEIPRADLAVVMATCLAQPATVGATFEVVTGDDRIATAVARSGLGDATPGDGRA